MAEEALRSKNERGVPRVVIGHPYLGRGGSEACVMWLVEALKQHYRLAVLTTGGFQLRRLNETYGTAVSPSDVELLRTAYPMCLRRYPLAMLRWAFYQRACRQFAHEFDVRISAYNCTDWGLPAIHFLADFAWERKPSAVDGHVRWFYRDTFVRRFYLAVAHRIMRPSGRDPLQQDWVIANSYWSARKLEQMGVRCRAVVYPPVWSVFPNRAWEDREFAFVVLGRIAPEKRIEFIIDVLREVRRQGIPINLYLAGAADIGVYGRQIARLCATHADWIQAVGYVTAARKKELLLRCRFGINACEDEAFGISVAEMIRAGCIPFVSAGSACAELVAHPLLEFRNREDAVRRIIAVLRSEELQAQLRDHLAQRASLFSLERTLEAFRGLVAEFLKAFPRR